MIAKKPQKEGCRWPIGDPGMPGFHFCDAQPVVPKRPYCVDHCRVAYKRDEDDPKAPKPQRRGTGLLARAVA